MWTARAVFGGKAFPGTVRQYNPGTQPFLKVNRNGERFANESCPYNDIVYAAAHQPGRVYAQIHDANFAEDMQSVSTPSAALPCLVICLRWSLLPWRSTSKQV